MMDKGCARHFETWSCTFARLLMRLLSSFIPTFVFANEFKKQVTSCIRLLTHLSTSFSAASRINEKRKLESSLTASGICLKLFFVVLPPTKKLQQPISHYKNAYG